MIELGAVYWLDEMTPNESKAKHPHVVVQATELNVSRINTVVVCALSTNMRNAHDLGNVLLNEGEGNLPMQSFVAVGQVSVVKKECLKTYIGKLSESRVNQVLSGIKQRALANKGEWNELYDNSN